MIKNVYVLTIVQLRLEPRAIYYYSLHSTEVYFISQTVALIVIYIPRTETLEICVFLWNLFIQGEDEVNSAMIKFFVSEVCRKLFTTTTKQILTANSYLRHIWDIFWRVSHLDCNHTSKKTIFYEYKNLRSEGSETISMGM